MKGLILPHLIIFLVCLLPTGAMAGPLEKYDSGDSFKSAPKSTRDIREEKIQEAVRNLRNADDSLRDRMLNEYQKRIDKALEQKNYSAADFYQEILNRYKQ
ncbi:MAG: hypothetical protein OEZ39_19190 [Gammaproteobacteria bacterium]|nr:hypothetical protein [Gammaproteobacteria bacterium]MDH5653991.1 hypothetical protein [Gammaproteobacteria bacterium]